MTNESMEFDFTASNREEAEKHIHATIRKFAPDCVPYFKEVKYTASAPYDFEGAERLVEPRTLNRDPTQITRWQVHVEVTLTKRPR